MQALWALVIGLQLSLSSLALGHRTALCVHRWLLREGRAGSAKPPGTAERHSQPRDSQGQPPGPRTNGGTYHDQQPGQQWAMHPRAARSLHHGGTLQPNGSIELAAVAPPTAHAALHQQHASPAEQHGVQIAAELRTRKGQPAAADRSSDSAPNQNGAERRWSLKEVEQGLPGSDDMDEEEREDAAEEKINSGAVPWCDGPASHAMCPSPRSRRFWAYHNMLQHMVSRDRLSVMCCAHVSEYE